MSIWIKDWDIIRAQRSGKEAWVLQGYCYRISGVFKGIPVKALVKEVRLIRIGLIVKCSIWFYCEYAYRKKGKESILDDEGFRLWTKPKLHLGER